VVDDSLEWLSFYETRPLIQRCELRSYRVAKILILEGLITPQLLQPYEDNEKHIKRGRILKSFVRRTSDLSHAQRMFGPGFSESMLTMGTVLVSSF
jgi:hypothetical protein